jgi:UDP-N-acetylmuramate--alanine ligase
MESLNKDNFIYKENFHLIGIKGTGMSSLASILKDLGFNVTGSDVEEEFFTSKKLREKNLTVLSFDKDNIKEDTVYIASSCYGRENVEVEEVLSKGYEFYYYHNFIEHFFKTHKIGVSGTHGKTTTTNLTTNFFKGEAIAYLIGDGSGGGEINYEYFIFEACEYKNHLLEYTFSDLVINNIELDHPDFFHNVDEVVDTFQKAAQNAKRIIINADDENCLKLKHDNILSFGIYNGDIRASIIKAHQNGFSIEVKVKDLVYSYFIPFVGIHMIYNFLAAFSVCYLNNIDLDSLQEKLLNGVRPSRRMEEYFYYDNIIIDDYAHHPKEIEMCLSGIKQKYPDKDLVVVFQPHTYSRTLALKDDFKKVFTGVKLYLAKTFTSKRESMDKNLDSEVMAIFPEARVFQVHDLKEFKLLHDTVILFLGAGVINKYISEFK